MFNKVLLPIDLNDPSSWRKALPVAIAQCRAYQAELYVMTAVPDLGTSLVAQYFPADFQQQQLEEATRQLGALIAEQIPADVSATSVVGVGTVYEEIIKSADETGADLIVMAAHRPVLSDFLLGPNAERVVRHGNRSVMVVRE